MNRISRTFTVLALTMALAGTWGCASRQDMETIQSERQRDRARIQQLEQELEESRVLLKEEIEKSQSPVRQKTADIWAEIQGLRMAFAKLRGELETMEIRMDRQLGAADSPTTVSSLERRIKEIEFALENQLHVELPKTTEDQTAQQAAATGVVAGAATEAVAGQDAPKTAPKAPAKESPKVESDPAKALYDKAYALYKEGKYDQARSYWAEFTETFRKHAYVGSALFWQGQCYYKLKDYARAVILYEDVIEKHKKSSKYKSALLRSGYSWSHLGKPELARMRLNEVIGKFPKTVEATQAKRFLEKMK
ncbi:tetratricopeptide repeat protein [Pseudodesulfovibrio tunisiensis]|uniref:tetratricopeptide repeat protein n=1 Tax=Pseudodesulfovibrio tunisiensis TaxID=463192 RepID=UPI001FB5607C|nr:tetratricopeptide repeat protein [Pseudodesulfovibrio tunisiensis]